MPLLAACVSETITIPPLEPKRVELPGGAPALEPGSALEREHRKLISGFGGEYRAVRAQAILSEISERLRLVSDRPSEAYKVTILNSPTVNAFALPNGYVYLTRGLLALANDSAEIASVIAHEIAHVSGRHAMERAELESRSVLVSRVQAEVLDNPGASQLMRDQSKIALASFSRQQELDADEAGIRAIAKAGFESYGGARFLIALDRSSQMRGQMEEQPSREGTDILSTHPATPERISRVISIARQYGTPGVGEANRSTWLAALNGIVYGEDPAQGSVRGRRFVHSRLRFSFDAPEGFVLENTPHAVLGVTAGAKQAMRFDSSRADPSRSLSAVLVGTPIEGIPVTDIEESIIGTLPAATGLARGSDWTFRIILLRSGETVHRMIFAVQNFTPEIDALFMETAASFKRLSEDEARAIRPQVIRLITARAEEKSEDLVRLHMPKVSQGLERFLVINGLSPEEFPVPGAQYKVIAGGE